MKLFSLMSFHVLMNGNPDTGGGGAPAAAPTTGAPATPAPATPATPAAPATPATPPASSGADFLPEAYRQDPAFAKYKSQDEFFKGYKNLQEMIGKKEIVNGIQVPGADAKDEDYENFYKQIGKPETADKYQLPEDVKLPEGYDMNSERKAFAEIIHKAGLTQKQATVLFKEYAAALNKNNVPEPTLEEAKKLAFGDDVEANFDLANKGAKTFGLLDKIEAAGQGRNPIVLQLCAELGKLAGEGTYHDSNTASSSRESLEAEAKALQNSQAYRDGDPTVKAKVASIWKRLYPN